jgi:hypothetical protein
MFDGGDASKWGLIALGGLIAVVGVASRASSRKRHPAATRRALGFYVVSMLSFVVYQLSTRDVIDALHLQGDASTHLRVALQALVPLIWAIGAFPAVAIDRTLHASPHSVHPLRLKTATEGGLALALGLAMLFPINWLATEYNKRFDFGFTKTTAVGDSTRSLVANLTEPIRVVLFFPASSDVLPEIKPYFDDLEGPNVSVEVMDAAMAPDLAKEWKVRDNGNVAIVKGDNAEIVKIGEKEDAARKELKKLDSKVQTALLKLARDKRTAYFTVGHNEFFWKNAPSDEENIDGLKKVVEAFNFKTKELGVDDGLAQAVPDDAAVVFITGPRQPFLPEEIKALQDYRDKGGAVFLMLEPTQAPDPALAALFGVEYDPSTIVTDKGYARKTGGPTDRAIIGTNKFSSHESVTTLNKNSTKAVFITPEAGSVKEIAGDHPGKVTTTVKGMPDWWHDLNGNYEFDKDTEKRGSADIAAVASGPAEGGKEWRAAIVGDATWATKMFIIDPVQRYEANFVYLAETLAWLTEDPALGGEVESEEDVKIQHTKEGEAVWFYGTSVMVPALVMIGGIVRVTRRRRKGAA